MDSTVISAILALIGSLCGTFAGIVTSSKLTEYRIKELEKKQDKHNTLIERTYVLEQKYAVLDNKEKVSEHRIDDLERRQSVCMN